MKVPFLDLKLQYQSLRAEIEPEVLKVFNNCSFIGGTFVQNFESQMAAYLSVKHAIGCDSGTGALTLALRACNIRPGDEVITTSFTFFATAEAISSIGAIPVFVDVKQSDYTIDPDKIERAITAKTRAILPVHIFGAPCEMDKIMEIAKKNNLKVIEDDAQAIGSTYKGRKAGTLGDVGCFSFYPTKNLGGCGDGGMVTTNNDDLATIILALREHGAGQNGAEALRLLEGADSKVSASQTTEKVTELYNPYKYFNYIIGYNSRLDAVQAAALSVKLRHLDDFNAKRADIAKRYLTGLNPKITRPIYDEKTIVPCWHQFVIRSKYKQELCDYLSEHDVGNGTFYPVPMHQQKAFNRNNSRNAGARLPVAEEICSQSVCLPIFPELSEEQVNYVIETVNDFYGEKE